MNVFGRAGSQFPLDPKDSLWPSGERDPAGAPRGKSKAFRVFISGQTLHRRALSSLFLPNRWQEPLRFSSEALELLQMATEAKQPCGFVMPKRSI